MGVEKECDAKEKFNLKFFNLIVTVFKLFNVLLESFIFGLRHLFDLLLEGMLPHSRIPTTQPEIQAQMRFLREYTMRTVKKNSLGLLSHHVADTNIPFSSTTE
ncbi:unnamed protein product [Sphenostylis stenocarpa]|uniref:Uncharacterized protein n=1 Tax=Sphenostylis stenocarpa TaxID=92480 RepID=A0AA86V8C2_9FABA|nr:unnamed protein product [Sphenostylis stenocarpa]